MRKCIIDTYLYYVLKVWKSVNFAFMLANVNTLLHQDKKIRTKYVPYIKSVSHPQSVENRRCVVIPGVFH
jgi:hypothetical protein